MLFAVAVPTVIDRIIQQAMLQQLMPIYEPLFSDDSFGYRPGREAKDAIFRIKEYIEQGYTRAVALDLSKYFDTLNHTILLNLLRKQVKDERVIQMVKRYLKSGVMENGVVTETEEGSPQGGLCGAPHKEPCGVPREGYVFSPFGRTTGAFSISFIMHNSFLSRIPNAHI